MKVYKLTDRDGYTRRGKKGESKWGEGVTYEAVGGGAELCTKDVIHYCDDLALALFMNPVHADLKDPLVWEAEIRESCASDGLKGGAKRLTTLRIVEAPTPTTEQRVGFGILCSLELPQSGSYVKWANCWLDGSNRSRGVAAAAARAAARAARAAEAAARVARAAAAARAAAGGGEAAARSAARAAEAAARVARAAAEARAAAWSAARAAEAAGGGETAAWAARAAARAAEAAAWAARAAEAWAAWAVEAWAAEAAAEAAEAAARSAAIDFPAIARKAMELQHCQKVGGDTALRTVI